MKDQKKAQRPLCQTSQPTQPRKTLALHRETLRALTAEQLGQIAGGDVGPGMDDLIRVKF